jgi:isopenicillin N synthase-like dioxygenase
MEIYFQRRGKTLYDNQVIEEIYPELAYQTGATPEFKERARGHQEVNDAFVGANRASTPQPPPYDAKWRYFWQMSESGIRDKFTPPNVTPKDFPQWDRLMNGWGDMMVQGSMIGSQMAAVGMDMPQDTFSKLLVGGHHMLAPTGSDLERYDVGTVFAGLHYDLNFLSIHGKSRYPGLFVWLRSGEKISVAVPEGHLLLQAGK